MSKDKYTPEPWRAFNNGQGVVGVSTDRSDVCWTRVEEGCWLDSNRTIDTDYENASRIAACVNACAGIPTYQLTAENDNPTNLGEVIDAIRDQRDELLAALERCRFALEPYDDIKPRDWKSDRANLRNAHQLAVAAIAGVKGEQ